MNIDPPHEVPVYEQAVVSLIDVLGFKDLVRSSPYEAVAETLGHFQKFSGADEIPQYEYSPEVFSFSDLIVRIRKSNPGTQTMHPIGLLILEIGDLLRTQALLIDQNILIRGAVTYGKISTSQGLLFGPALLDAYTHESEFSRYPRILVSESALRGLQDTDKPLAECKDRSCDKEDVRKLLRQADDGLWFIDYLSAIAEDFDYPEEYAKFLLRHRDVISLRYKALANSKGFSNKNMAREILIYKWLACYHNRCITEHGLDQNELRISPTEVESLYVF